MSYLFALSKLLSIHYIGGQFSASFLYSVVSCWDLIVCYCGGIPHVTVDTLRLKEQYVGWIRKGRISVKGLLFPLQIRISRGT